KTAFRARLDEILRGEHAADRNEAGEHGLVALGLAGFDGHADGDRRALAVGVGEAERDIAARLIAPPLVLAQRAQAIIDHRALGGATALALVARDRIEPLQVAVAAGEHDLSHVEDGRFARTILPEYASMAPDLDVLDVEQVPVDHRKVTELHHGRV